MTSYSEPEPGPKSDWLPLPVPEFILGNFVVRVLAAVLCILLMGWVATR